MKIAKEEISKHTVTKTFKERKENGENTGKYKPQNGRSDDITSEQITLKDMFESY
ncbi:hypothetical protein MSIBF_A1940001 [groundwater metagenome]|uniref:Uncharacterized protein n=1 Tax=groundwater metagenome TaxID=717931 RepID=A0A098E7U8_9ZZZZ